MNVPENIFFVPSNLKSNVLKSYEKNEKDVKEAIAILYDWWKKQPHLPYFEDDAYLEKLLLRNKFRIEQTKKKLDANFTLKGLYTDFFLPDNLNIKCSYLYDSFKCIRIIPLREPTKNNERVIFFKVIDPNGSEHFDIKAIFIICFMFIEMMLNLDYCVAVRAVSDLSNLKMAYYTKMEPNILMKGLKLWQEAFSYRIAGIHFFNAPNFIDLLVKLLNNFVKGNKIHVHSNMDAFYDFVPKHIMPAEYGGQSGKMDEVQDKWLDEIEKHQEHINKNLLMVSNEKLRIGESQYDDLFGTEGTFKKLNID